MATVKLNLEVTPANVQAYWIDIDDVIVPFTNGKGSKDLQSPGDYVLGWHFTGNAGSSIAIVGKVGDNKVVEVRKSSMPAGEHEAFGSKDFSA